MAVAATFGVAGAAGVLVANSVALMAGSAVAGGVEVAVVYLAKINVGVGVGRTPIVSKSLDLQASRMIIGNII